MADSIWHGATGLWLRLCAIRLALPAGSLPRGRLEACFQEGLPENMKIN